MFEDIQTTFMGAVIIIYSCEIIWAKNNPEGPNKNLTWPSQILDLAKFLFGLQQIYSFSSFAWKPH